MVASVESPEKMVGKAIKRREDPRLITGAGSFLDDVKLPGMTHAAIVRSPHAHAKIGGIDTSAARTMPGVLGVYTGDDFMDVNPLPAAWQAAGVKNNAVTPRVLAVNEVHQVGDPVAVVVAESQWQAADAAEAVVVDWEPLPAVVDAKKATLPGAPQLHAEAPNNVVLEWTCGKDAETVDAALAASEVRVNQHIVNQRLIPTSMETRGSIGKYDVGTGDYTLWATSQAPHVHRLLIAAFVLGIPEQKIRVISPDIGGGFGCKIFVYYDMPLVMVLSKKLGGRPVKFCEDRSENYVSTTHGRDHITDLEIGATKDGKITALKVDTFANLGAYFSTIAAGIPTTLYGRMLAGCYKMPNILCHVTGVYTNTAMVDAYRGAGRPEAAFVIERVVDLVADATGIDPAEVRRRNFIQPDDFPYDTGIGMLPYDSGNYEPALDLALEMVDYQNLRAEQKARRGERRPETARHRALLLCGGLRGRPVEMDRARRRRLGCRPLGERKRQGASHRQSGGHDRLAAAWPGSRDDSFAQLVSDELGVPYDDIQVEHSDTQWHAVRFWHLWQPLAGRRRHRHLQERCQDQREGERLAAHMLEAAEEDIVCENGKAFVRGLPASVKTIQEIALAAHVAYDLPEGMEPFLDETTYYDPPNCTFPFGTHICVVEVDKETGEVEPIRYIAVDDVGNVDQPVDRRRPDPRRHRPGAGAGALRGRRLQRRWPAADRIADATMRSRRRAWFRPTSSTAR